MLKRILTLSLTLCVLLTLSITASATEVSQSSFSVIEELKRDNYIDFADMSIDELNYLIDSIAMMICSLH